MAFQRKKPPAIGFKAPYPGFIEPALATSIDKVPNGERWIHEIKFDGYRVQLHIANESTTVFTRTGIDWTRRFKKIADDAFSINAASAIIDGEVVAPAADGTTDFSVLQNELKGKSTRIVMVALDLLYLNGYDLRKLPLVERKSHLKKLIARTAIQFSETFEVGGPRCTSMPARSALRAWSPKSATAAIRPAVAMTGSKHPRAARDTGDRRLRVEGQQVRRHLSRQAEG
jgi:bifunctional non-homologous end joining protein LigD